MPTSVPPSDDTPRPGLGSDTYSRAERRHLAEVAAVRLLETRTPVTSTVFGTRPPTEPTVATPKSVAGHTYTPEPDNAAPPPSRSQPARETRVIDFTAAKFNPLATFRSELTVRPQAPLPASTARFAPPRSMGGYKGAFGTITVLAMLMVVGISALVTMLWRGIDADAPAITRSGATRAETEPVDPGAVAGVVSSSAVATGSHQGSSAAATAIPATSESVPQPATRASRRTIRPPVARAANQDSTPVTPVSRPSVAQLRVTSTPPGARVTINGIGWGQTPVTVSNLPLGAKTVRLTIEGYRSQQRTVALRSAGDSAAVHMALKVDGGAVNR